MCELFQVFARNMLHCTNVWGRMNLSPPSPPRNGFMPAWCGHFFRLEFGGVYKKKARLPRAFFHLVSSTRLNEFG